MQVRIAELMDHLDAQREVLATAFQSVPPAAREQPPGTGRWSPANIVEHLAIVERRVGALLSARIAEARAAGAPRETSSEPLLPTMDLARMLNRTRRVTAPETSNPTGLHADDAWGALERAGAVVRDTLRAADGLALGAITLPHPVFGPLSLYEWFAVIGSHEARHAAQITEAAAV